MKICLLVIGKTDADYIRAGIEEYEKRLRKYVGYEMKVLPDVPVKIDLKDINGNRATVTLTLKGKEAPVQEVSISGANVCCYWNNSCRPIM